MVKCHLIKLSEVVMMLSTLSLVKLERETRPKICLPRFGTNRYWWSQNRNLQIIIPPRIINLRKRRCCEQLRQRTLHHRKRNRWFMLGQNQKIIRQLYWSPRFLSLPRRRRRNRIWIRIIIVRKIISWLRKEIQIRIHRIPLPISLNCRRWTIQQHLIYPLLIRTHRCLCYVR